MYLMQSTGASAHGRALQKHHQRRTTLVKFIHKILPLGARVHHYNKKYNPNCASCHAPNETQEHFWRCPAASRITWRRHFLKDLSQKLIDLRTGPEVRTLVVGKLRAVLDGVPIHTIPVPPSLEEIGLQHDQIGWDQLMLGRWGWAWNTNARTQPGTSTSRAGGWTTEVISFIFKQWWKLCESRNQDRHGQDLATKLQTQALQVDRELQLFYDEYSSSVPQDLQWIFDTHINTHRKRPTAVTRQWLNTWTSIIADALKTGSPPDGDPHYPENCPYSTALKIG